MDRIENFPISFVIASRNDNWCGDSLGRLRNTLRRIAEGPLGAPSTEIVLVDWASGTTLMQEISPSIHNPCAMRHIFVPREVAKGWPVTFCESVALNTGIRLARGKLICRLDQDTLVSDHAAKVLADNGTTFDILAAFSARREMESFQESYELFGPINKDCDAQSHDFFRGGVGVLAARRDIWHKVRGYDEGLIYRLHIEHDLCERMRNCADSITNLGPPTDYGFFHQWHERGPGDARQANACFTQNEIRQRLRGSFATNSSGWGLEHHQDKLQIVDLPGLEFARSDTKSNPPL